MAVSIQMGMKKPALKPEAAIVEAATVAPAIDPEVDEYVALLAWQAKQKKDAKAVRLAELAKKFADKAKEFDDEPDKDDIAFEGEKSRIKFGKRSHDRAVTPEGVQLFFEKVGEEAFLQVVTVGLGVLDKYVPEVEQDAYLVRSRGNRSPKVEAKV